ncbi:MAG: hypothetical protein OSA99_04560 [Acidimicrobiales bacterium]|nr:hypothetical protein [Acidimicrobiales bacterium]
MPQRPDRVQRQWRVPAAVPLVVAALVCGALIAVVASSGDDADPTPTTSAPTSTAETSTTSTTEPPIEPVDLGALTIAPLAEDPPARYRIAYDIVENALERQETWTVQRPFESLVVGTRDGALVSGSATSRSDLYTYLTDRDGWYSIQPELHRAAFDQRPLAAMATMIELGLAESAGSGEYAGRACSVYVTGAPLSSASVSPPGDERTEACIDDSGLLLYERWEIGDNVVTERTATSVEIDPDVDPAIFDPGPIVDDAPELDALLGNVAVEADEATLEDLRTDIVVPDGYALISAVFRSSTSDTGTGGAAETVRFYSDGVDLIELAEVTVGGVAELDGGGAVPVEIDGFEDVWFDPDFRASALRARLTETSFVELRGADPSRLVELLETISLR